MKPRSESGISGGTAFTDNRIDRGRQRERDRPSGSGRRGRSRSTSLDRKRRDKRRAERKGVSCPPLIFDEIFIFSFY